LENILFVVYIVDIIVKDSWRNHINKSFNERSIIDISSFLRKKDVAIWEHEISNDEIKKKN